MSKTVETILLVVGVVFLLMFSFPVVFPVLGLRPLVPFAARGIPLIAFRSLPLLLMVVVWAVVAAWTYRDAESRGMNGPLWALLVFFGNIIGLLVYLILRGGGTAAASGTRDAPACPKCKKTVETGWKVCPYCGAKLN
jgi:hypothetical protein